MGSNPIVSIGDMREWFKRPSWKGGEPKGSVSSNLTVSAKIN